MATQQRKTNRGYVGSPSGVLACLVASVAGTSGCFAQNHTPPVYCIPLIPPSVPDAPELRAEYHDVIADDFNRYLSDITDYFSCLDRERQRAFDEVRQVGEQYRQFLATTKAE